MHPPKKRPFLLLETLIAIALLSVCATILIRQPLLLYRAELSQLERIECDRIAAWTFTEIREKILKRQIVWSQIPPLKGQSKPFILPPITYQIPPIAGGAAERKYILETLREKMGSDGKPIRLLAILIEIKTNKKTHQFTYRLAVQPGK